MSSVQVDNQYRHKSSGNIYTVVLVANEKSDRWPVQVIYIDVESNVWARPLTEFLDKFEEVHSGS